MAAMEQSQYLAQALRSMQSTPAAAQAPDVAAMAKQAQLAKAWKAQNPGQSRLAANVRQMGSNLRAAPGRAAGAVGGLFGLGQQAQGMSPEPQSPYGGQQGVLQQSLMQNGNATPEFQVPEWARDGTPAGHPGLATYLNIPAQQNPYYLQNLGSGGHEARW